MNTLEHPVAPEEIMAMLDEELSSTERSAVLEHLSRCAGCAAVRDRLTSTSQALAEWKVPVVPETLMPAVRRAAEHAGAAAPKVLKPRRIRGWVLAAAGGAFAAVVAIALIPTMVDLKPRHLQMSPSTEPMPSAPAPAPPMFDDYLAPAKEGNLEARKGTVGGAAGEGSHIDALTPMIARNVALTMLVKNIPESRSALDRILASHAGYAANLTVNTPETGPRSFEASLRIPAQQLEPALTALRSMGQVETESQSGEEVTAQHEDLAARLQNARESEDRLRAILAQRAGKMDEILQVEEQIAQTRGEIEQMEAEQKGLEHRVDYATVDLQLTEQYEAKLAGHAAPIGTQLWNSLVTGIRNAGSSLLGLARFIEEVGPAVLVWIVILGIPTWFARRRYLRAHARL